MVRKTGKLGGTRRTRRSRKPEVTLVDTVHQIWLAGVGALARAQKEGPKAFETLIVDGAGFVDRSRNQAEKTLRDAIGTVQTAVEDRMRETKDQATETWDSLEKIFQTRVQRVLQQVGVPTARDIGALLKRVDQLNANVVALNRKRVPRAKPVAKRRAPKVTERKQAEAA